MVRLWGTDALLMGAGYQGQELRDAQRALRWQMALPHDTSDITKEDGRLFLDDVEKARSIVKSLLNFWSYELPKYSHQKPFILGGGDARATFKDKQEVIDMLEKAEKGLSYNYKQLYKWINGKYPDDGRPDRAQPGA
ncbi:MAG: hypothetical protein SOZ92_00595 [Porphyromonas somerae]|nr:hypothetical protein [Porphyromonas somerae]